MTLDEFHQSLTATEPPAGLTHALAGLWWDARGDWKKGAAAETPMGLERQSLAASTAVSR
jgi:hypothetical protein